MRIAHRFVALTILLLSFVLAPVSVAHAAPSAPPTISGFWPGEGAPGKIVFVFGANFDPAPGGTQVAANGIDAPIVQVLDSSLLIFLLPSGDTVGPITVTTAAGTATSSANFGPDTSGVPVLVNGFWPSEGAPGKFVFVFGKGFQGATDVRLNGQEAPIMQVLDSGLLFFIVPPDATTGTITVTTPAGVAVTIDLFAVRRSGPITLIHTGDIHGALEGHINLRSDSTGRIEGGLARAYTKIKEIRARTPGKNLYINSGDTVQGSAEIMFTRGQAMIDVLNLFGGIDAHAPGNWDFLYGTDRFIETFVGKNGAPPLAPWNALAANLYYATLAQDPTTPYPDKAGQNVLPPYRTVFVNRMKVGIIGLTTVRGIPAVGASVNKGFFYTNGDASGEVKKYVDILRNKEKVDLVVITSELELANGVVLANKYPGIDVILSADMHEKTTVPIVASTGTILVEEGEDAGVVGEVTFNIAGGKVQTWAFKQHAITDLIKEDPTIAAKIKEVIKPFHSGPDFNPNQSVTIGGNTAKLRRPLDTVIGYTAIPLHRSNFSHEDMPAAVEGSAHNFFADAMKWATGADFAAIRGFRYGTHIPVGPITYGDLFHWIPLAARIGKASPVFGGNLQDQVNQSTRSVFDPNPQLWRGGWMFGYSGVTYDLNASRPHGCRGKNIKVGGVPIDTKAYFKSVYLTSFADGSQAGTASTATAKVTGRYDGYRPAIPATGAQPPVPEVLPTYALTIVVKGISPAQLVGAPGVHIHLGSAGTNGPIIVDLGATGWVATADGMSKTISGSFPLAYETDLLNGNTYLNVHTATNLSGEIRGQLSILSSQMDGVQAGSGSTATGLVTGRYDRHLEEVVVTPTTPVAKPAVPGKYSLNIVVKGISPAELVGAPGVHIHLGAPGTNGPIIVDLGITGWVATADGMTLSTSGDFPIANEPDLLLGNTYVQVHTVTNRTGAIRGQLPKPMARSYKVAGYWFADDPSTINNCGACTGDSGGGIDVVKDPVTGEYLDLTEIVVNYLQSLPAQTANPSLHRITLTKPLPAPVYGFNEIQPLKGAPPAVGDVCP